jgi:hypothetical protein
VFAALVPPTEPEVVPPTEPAVVPPAAVLPPVLAVLLPVLPPVDGVVVDDVDVELLPPTLPLGPELGELLLPQPTTVVPKTSALSFNIFVVRIESSDCGGQSSPQFSVVTGRRRPLPSYSPGIGSCTGSNSG